MVPYSVFFANSSGIPFNHEAAHEILMHTIESSGTPCQASHQILMHWGGSGSLSLVVSCLVLFPIPQEVLSQGSLGGMLGSLFLVVASLGGLEAYSWRSPFQPSSLLLRHPIRISGIPLHPQAYH